MEIKLDTINLAMIPNLSTTYCAFFGNIHENITIVVRENLRNNVKIIE
jgi:hypothetical protein